MAPSGGALCAGRKVVQAALWSSGSAKQDNGGVSDAERGCGILEHFSAEFVFGGVECLDV